MPLTATPSEAVREAVVPGGMRWWVAALLFLVTLINLIDRSTIAVLAPVITGQLGLSNLQFAGINVWFQVPYAFSQGLSGKIFDRIGTRRGFTVAVLIWSVAASAHAFTRGLRSLSGLRFLLGVGEGGNWPGAAKVIAEWFPVRERALGISIVNAASAIASIVAPPMVVWLQITFGWRTTFLVTGALGFLWLALWLLFYQAPEQQALLTSTEYALIRQDRNVIAAAEGPGWLDLLGYRQVWAIVVARFLADPVWWLYLTWLPLYLYNVRGFSLKQIGLFLWLPYVAASAGSLLGGWSSGSWIACGWSVNRARKTVIAAAALLMPASIFAAYVRSPMTALALISVVLFGFQAWIGNVQTMPSDFFPETAVGSVAGLGGLGAGIGSMLFTLATGWVTDHLHTYTPILVAAGLLPILATVVLFAVGGTIGPLQPESVSSMPERVYKNTE
jgi:ACS family hexuronate transporter-like MFS transporter